VKLLVIMTPAALSSGLALVTGGNRGIGLEVCKQLVQRGKPVLLACRDLEAGKAAAQTLQQANSSSEVKVISLDTNSSASIQKLAELVKAEYDQKIDLLVNNAGILFTKTWSEEAYSKTMAVNVAGPVAISQALLPLLAPGALIVMVSSGLGQLANISPDYKDAIQSITDISSIPTAVPFNPDSPMGTSPPGAGAMTPTYSVVKALLNRSVQLMSADEKFKQRGVSVVSTCPGWCRTDMGTSAADRSAEQGGSSVLWPYFNWKSDLNGSFTRDGGQLVW
jgi:NAD(P)-dependent dehydrogenase (short-subunit alcohol dehydrogenase family)